MDINKKWQSYTDKEYKANDTLPGLLPEYIIYNQDNQQYFIIEIPSLSKHSRNLFYDHKANNMKAIPAKYTKLAREIYYMNHTTTPLFDLKNHILKGYYHNKNFIDGTYKLKDEYKLLYKKVSLYYKSKYQEQHGKENNIDMKGKWEEYKSNLLNSDARCVNMIITFSYLYIFDEEKIQTLTKKDYNEEYEMNKLAKEYTFSNYENECNISSDVIEIISSDEDTKKKSSDYQGKENIKKRKK